MTRSITTGFEGGPSPAPSASIASTVSIPSVTLPTTAYSGGRPASGAGDDEELAARGPRRLGLRLRHRDDASGVGGVGRRHVDGLVARPAASRPGRVAALDHEAGHDAMEGRAVEEAALGERDERGGRLRRRLLVELDRERAAVRLDDELVGLVRRRARPSAPAARRRPSAPAPRPASHSPSTVVVARRSSLRQSSPPLPLRPRRRRRSRRGRRRRSRGERQSSRMGDRDRSVSHRAATRPVDERARDLDLVRRARQRRCRVERLEEPRDRVPHPRGRFASARRPVPPRRRRARTTSASGPSPSGRRSSPRRARRAPGSARPARASSSSGRPRSAAVQLGDRRGWAPRPRARSASRPPTRAAATPTSANAHRFRSIAFR